MSTATSAIGKREPLYSLNLSSDFVVIFLIYQKSVRFSDNIVSF